MESRIPEPADPEGGLFRHRVWNIGVVDAPIHEFLRPGHRPAVRWMSPVPEGTYLADPFAIVRDRTIHVLCEEFDYRSRRGVISALSLGGNGSSTRPRPVIELSTHVSYPYLFEHAGEVYCVPETSRAREVALFRATDFPIRWTKAAVLLDGVAGIDNTIFRHDGRWWLLCTDVSRPNERLLVFHASDPFGPWLAHPLNPVKSDASSSRPAGTPFVYDGALYRPAQDNSRIYGHRIVINRVLRLSPQEFAEEKAAVVEPLRGSPYPDGIHTISAAGQATLLDAFRLTFVQAAFRHALSRRITDVTASLRGILHQP